jgi:hypothetical protein
MCIGATSSVAISQAGFDVALKQYPDDRLTLHNGIILMRDSYRQGRKVTRRLPAAESAKADITI